MSTIGTGNCYPEEPEASHERDDKEGAHDGLPPPGNWTCRSEDYTTPSLIKVSIQPVKFGYKDPGLSRKKGEGIISQAISILLIKKIAHSFMPRQINISDAINLRLYHRKFRPELYKCFHWLVQLFFDTRHLNIWSTVYPVRIKLVSLWVSHYNPDVKWWLTRRVCIVCCTSLSKVRNSARWWDSVAFETLGEKFFGETR